MLIRASESAAAARSAVVLDLGDIAEMGTKLKAQAAAEAERILEEAHRQREELLAGGAEEGRRQGYQAGLEEGREEGRRVASAEAGEQAAAELKHIRAGFESALGKFEESRELMLREARSDMLRLAMVIARRITKRAIDAEPGAVATQLEAILEHVAAGSKLRIEVSAGEHEGAMRALPELAKRASEATHVEVAARDDLAPGDVIVTTSGGARIDARIDVQLDRLAAELIPGEAEERTDDLTE